MFLTEIANQTQERSICVLLKCGIFRIITKRHLRYDHRGKRMWGTVWEDKSHEGRLFRFLKFLFLWLYLHFINMKFSNLSNISSCIVYWFDFYKQPDSRNDPKQTFGWYKAPYLLNYRTVNKNCPLNVIFQKHQNPFLLEKHITNSCFLRKEVGFVTYSLRRWRTPFKDRSWTIGF